MQHKHDVHIPKEMLHFHYEMVIEVHEKCMNNLHGIDKMSQTKSNKNENFKSFFNNLYPFYQG